MGHQCQLGFYSFHYQAQDSKEFLITEDGNENTYKLDIPLDHRLNIATFTRTHTDSEALEIRYIPAKQTPDYYEILYANSALTARSVIVELGDAYENVGGAELHYVITGTNTKKWMPRVNIQFLEKPVV